MTSRVFPVAAFAGLLFASLCPVASVAQAPAAGSKPAPISCSVRRTPQSPGDLAVMQDKTSDALKLYEEEAKAPGDAGFRARNARIRLQLRKTNFTEGEKEARAWLASDPKNPWAQEVVAMADLRGGAIDKAGEEFRAAIVTSFCNAQAHADYATYLAFTGFNASAKSQLEIAHKLDSVDSSIGADWAEYQPRAVRAAELDKYLQHATFLKDDERKHLEEERDELKGAPKYPCTLVSPLKSAVVPFHAIRNKNASNGQGSQVEWGLAVGLDNSNRRLKIDSGASGIVLTRAAASSMGLKVEKREEVSGVDAHVTPVSIANVHDIKINGLEFHDCAVEVLEQDVMITQWDADVSFMEGQDGLIGTDVFKDFLITLDFPGKVMKLDPLPPLPDGAATAAASMDTGAESAGRAAFDRYVAPSMTSWTKVFRNGHELFVPVRVNGGPIDLFLVDTGAGVEVITPQAASAVGKVSKVGTPGGIIGVSGEAVNVGSSGPLTLDFAGLRQPVPQMSTINLDHLSYPSAVSGILGQYTLHQLTIQIDYRDQLMKFTYDAGRITHCVPGVSLDDCY